MTPKVYQQMMAGAEEILRACSQSGGDTELALKEWMRLNGRLSKGEQRIVRERAFGRRPSSNSRRQAA